jgi:bifunctional NMN adenylyltransferase/nudix hydrolase
MKEKTIKADVGVVIGRFQVPELHDAHIDLVQSVVDRHPKVIIFLGLSPCKTTYNNPLDFESRKQMILQKFPDVNVLYIKDECSDEVWSRKLDSQVEDLLGANQKAVLYGSRDSFIPHYKGHLPVIELEPNRIISGTELRKEASNKVKSSPDFRHGVIWGVNNQYPSCMPTVDVAIVDTVSRRVLLAKKPSEKLYRFVGGFASPKSESYEIDAKREAIEETGLEIGEPEYIGSTLIDDWRYRKENNKIKTMFFVSKYIFGSPQANDDISEVRWFDLNSINDFNIVSEHRPLVTMFLNWVAKNQSKWTVDNVKVP